MTARFYYNSDRDLLDSVVRHNHKNPLKSCKKTRKILKFLLKNPQKPAKNPKKRLRKKYFFHLGNPNFQIVIPIYLLLIANEEQAELVL
jgi:hypothetical protein